MPLPPLGIVAWLLVAVRTCVIVVGSWAVLLLMHANNRPAPERTRPPPPPPAIQTDDDTSVRMGKLMLVESFAVRLRISAIECDRLLGANKDVGALARRLHVDMKLDGTGGEEGSHLALAMCGHPILLLGAMRDVIESKQNKSQIEFQLEVPSASVGFLIGFGGRTVTRIEGHRFVHIRFVNEGVVSVLVATTPFAALPCLLDRLLAVMVEYSETATQKRRSDRVSWRSSNRY